MILVIAFGFGFLMLSVVILVSQYFRAGYFKDLKKLRDYNNEAMNVLKEIDK